jgi:hypothetical protein
MARLLIFVGLVVLVRGCGDLRAVWRAAEEPQSLSCAQLLQEGPGDNAHVTLTGCRLCLNSVLELERKAETDTLWVPISVPNGSCPQRTGHGPLASAAGAEPPILARFDEDSEDVSLDSLALGAPLSGLVLHRLAAMPKEVKRYYYGYGDWPASGWILELGQARPGWGRAFGILGGSLALILAGVFGPALFGAIGGAGEPEGEERGLGLS